ncbi:MAG: hypothetical protein KBA26_01195 [Candidatus Delongbacteria bacterium]|nr:hypothetical protein [Candidatus Delongbacteria bacterium]
MKKKRQINNRDAAVEDRKYFLKKAYTILNSIIYSYNAWILRPDFLELLETSIKDFILNLYNSRHFTFISVGGDLENLPDDIPLTERIFVDHIETLYAKAQYIQRFIIHQKALRDFKNLVDNDDVKLQRYLDQIIETDNNTILRDMNLIQMRIDAYRRFIELF